MDDLGECRRRRAERPGPGGRRSHPGARLGCGACSPGLCGPLFAAVPEDPRSHTGVQGPALWKGAPLSGADLLSCGTLSLLPRFPTPTSERLPTDSVSEAVSSMSPLPPLYPPGHLLLYRPPPLQGYSPPVSYHSPWKSL